MKLFRVFMVVLFLFGASFAQELTKENYIQNKGKMTQEDYERIFGDIYKPNHVFETQGDPRAIKEVIINGNKITTVIFNYGSICKPNYLNGIADLVWQGLGYGFEFGLLTTAEVKNSKGQTLHITSDSHVLIGQGDYSPDGTLKWGWLPRPGYADPDQTEVATLNAGDEDKDGKPDSWPDHWYLEGAGQYVWPAFLGDQATAPDQEVYWVMDDFTNQEFDYDPFPSYDGPEIKKGLGLLCEARLLQFNNPMVEDLIFVVYRITNVSEKTIDKIYFGMHGDPHVGGGSDYGDDRAYFIPPDGPLAESYPQRSRSMVYAFDGDMKGVGGRRAGFFGWKMLETPTDSWNSIDDDDDGISDESPYNDAGFYIDGSNYPLTYGIADVETYTDVYGAPKARWSGDEDGDWDPDLDDVGIDGIGIESSSYPGPDLGEDDGKPSQAWYHDINDNGYYDSEDPISEERTDYYLYWAGSEPNFGLRDISESDQIGLSSFHAASYGNSANFPYNDPLMWEWLSSDSIDPSQDLLQSAGDNIFNFGTGPMTLEPGETQRFSMAILFGNNLNELVLNAENATRVLEADYRFAKPPLKPNLKVVPGDGRVHLYWDTRAEKSFDPFVRDNDFQGYKIYRSTDPSFSDIYKITDGQGNPFLGVPLYDNYSRTSAQFDLDDSISGYHPVEFQGRSVKYYLGDNTGLVHEFVDSTVQNGVQYYYAVVAYHRGSEKLELPPTETQAVIFEDPITGELTYDINTATATPNPEIVGLVDAKLKSGGVSPLKQDMNSTGDIIVKFIDNIEVDEKAYKIDFEADSTDDLYYNILDSTGVDAQFTSKGDVFVEFGATNIRPGSVTITDSDGIVVDTADYFVDYLNGKIKGVGSGLPEGNVYDINFRYYPVYKSYRLSKEDGNDIFNGMKVYIKDDSLGLAADESEFITGDFDVIATFNAPSKFGTVSNNKPIRADWEITFNDLTVDAQGNWVNVADTALNDDFQPTVAPFTIRNITADTTWFYIITEPTGSPTADNGQWDWGERISLLGDQAPNMSYDVTLDIDTTVSAPVLPSDGDIFLVKTSKPFEAGDSYYFETQPSEEVFSKGEELLDNVYVVPNPYVAYSGFEQPGRTAELRGEKELQFRNLPRKCTVRIYTITGELVDTIEKDDSNGYVSWDLLSYEGQKIAYGVYIFHVDAPGIGEKIGRFAVIK